MNNQSLWNLSSQMPVFKELKGSLKTDVLIIGGGMCGILCAYFLKKAGVDYALIEAKKIAQGVTANTTAKITALHGLIYDELLRSLGEENAKKYLTINQLAIEKYEALCKDIPCNFKKLPAFTYSVSNRHKIEDEAKALSILGFRAEFKESSPLPVNIVAAVGMKNQAQFDPLRFLSEISKDLNIYENTAAISIAPNLVECASGKIEAKKIIVATHFPFLNKHGSYFLKLYQHRSYVLALEAAQDLDGMYIDEAQKGLSFRNEDNYLLLGGGSHRTGKSGGNWAELMDFAKKNYPNSNIKYKWATQDCMSLDKIPYIGQYSAKTPNLYVATGFNKWGMSTSMASAMILSDLVQEKDNDFKEVFSPSRSILKPQLFVNGIESVSNLLCPTKRRCPHLGCALKWNKAEHTWDCPCHGSRFDADGNLINNPATKGIDL